MRKSYKHYVEKIYRLKKEITSKLRKHKRRGTLVGIKKQQGFCYFATVSDAFESDAESHSTLRLFENGKQLIPSHSLHEDIENIGKGRYSHWLGYVLFSTSDNSDPRLNGRSYSFYYHGKLKFVANVRNPLISFSNEIKSDNGLLKYSKLKENRKLKIVLYIGSLYAGGAERQLCYFAVWLKQNDFNVIVLTLEEIVGELAHFKDYLIMHGVTVRQATVYNASFQNVNLNAFDSIPQRLKDKIVPLVSELAVIKPDILHCWLDYTNLVGGIAGFITSIPKILFGMRNVNPTHFKLMNERWFKPWYGVLIRSKRVFLVNNSKVGTDDYARWLDISPERIKTIYNGVDFEQLENAKLTDGSGIRQSLNIIANTPLVGGIFRLNPEKSPGDFLKVITKVREKLSNIKAVIVGTGPLEGDILKYIGRNALSETVLLLGRRTDVFDIIKACNVILLTSVNEGTPNIIYEAQLLGVPVVSTTAGGVPEIVQDQKTGLLCKIGDIDSLADCVSRILQNGAYGKELGGNGRRFILDNYSIEKMSKEYLHFYKTLE